MWMADYTDDKLYSYNHPLNDDASLSALSISPKNIIGFAADRTSYEVGVASTVTQATVAATANHPSATVGYSGTDASSAAGHQVNLSAGKNTVTVTVTAQDTTTQAYTVNINRGVTTAYGWKAEDDLDGLIAVGNQVPTGIWSNGTTMWVADFTDDKLYAYQTSDGSRDSNKDFNTLSAAGNNSPIDIWSNGTTMWVADYPDDKLYAYRMSDKARDSGKDFNTLRSAGNGDLGAIWSDNTTMWVADNVDVKLYAYRMSDKARDASKDFGTLSTAGNDSPTGIWSNGTTMWVADYADHKLYAYRMSDKARDAGNDFNTLRGAGNNDSAGIWSNGETMWVVDDSDDKVYSYNMSIPAPPDLRATAGDRQVALSWEDPDRSEITGYQYRVSDDDGNSWNPDWTPIPGSRTSTTSHTVRNLTNGVSYTFEVRAQRNDLNGPAARVTATPIGPPSAPGTPVNLRVAVRDGGLFVNWDSPRQDSRAPVTSYSVRYRMAGSSASWSYVSRSSTDTSRNQLITGLTNRRHYEVQVAAVNRISTGNYASATGTPQGPPEPPPPPPPLAPNEPSPEPLPEISVGALGAYWTDRFGSNTPNPDTDGNLLISTCVGNESFRVLWAGPPDEDVFSNPVAAEWDAHVTTGEGAGQFSYSFRNEYGNSNFVGMYGTVSINGVSILTVRVRGRFGD